MQTQILEQIGMSKSEIKVYFALQELGISKVGPILDKSKVPNSKIYLLLNRLIERGLITSTIKDNTKIFIAESPNRLLDYIEKKKEELNKEKDEIKKILPNLLAKQKQISGNSSKVFEGRKGIYSAYEDVIETIQKEGGEQLYFSLGKKDYEQNWIKNFFKDFQERKVKLKIESKGIYPTENKGIYKEDKFQKFKYVDVVTPTGIVIYSSKVLILDFDNLIVFMLDSFHVAEKYRNMFYKIWKEN